jgi:tripartite-type tricarboxylate transporter receptor subunit TctC
MPADAFALVRSRSITTAVCAGAALLAAAANFSNYRGFIGAPGLNAAQVAYWEGVLARLDADESWRAYVDKNELDRQLMNGREALAFLSELDGRLREILGDLGLLKASGRQAAR